MAITKTTASGSRESAVDPAVRTRLGLFILVVLLAAVALFLTRSGARDATREEELTGTVDFTPAAHIRAVRPAVFADALRSVWGSAVTVQNAGGKMQVTLAAGTRTADFYNNNPRLLEGKQPALFTIRHDDARETLKAEFSLKSGAVQVPTDVLFALAKNFAALPQNASPDGR